MLDAVLRLRADKPMTKELALSLAVCLSDKTVKKKTIIVKVPIVAIARGSDRACCDGSLYPNS